MVEKFFIDRISSDADPPMLPSREVVEAAIIRCVQLGEEVQDFVRPTKLREVVDGAERRRELAR